MRHSFYFFFFTFSLIFLLQAVASDIVKATCMKIAQEDPKVKLDFCVKFLGADPKSHTADLQGLGVISVNLIEANANEIDKQIKKLVANKTVGGDVKMCLNDCQELFSDAIDCAEMAIADFKSKDYSSANVHISAVMDSSMTCEDGFKQRAVVSPLKKENNDFVQKATISLIFTTMLK